MSHENAEGELADRAPTETEPPPAVHWNDYVRRWSHIGPPLRPGEEDIRLFEALVSDALTAATGTHLAVLLGVTAEIARMKWPAGRALVAIDQSPGMVAGIWPRDDVAVPATAVVGDWRNLPLADRSASIAIGDGCYSMLVTARSYDRLSSELARVLKPEGRCIVRLFVRPERPETIGAVVDDLKGGRIGNFHIFKWRLAMAVPAGEEFDVRLGDIWSAWEDTGIDPVILATGNDWPLTAVETIRAYRDNDTRYTFLPLAVMRQRAAPYFVELGHYVQGYELAERCPTMLLAPREGARRAPAV